MLAKQNFYDINKGSKNNSCTHIFLVVVFRDNAVNEIAYDDTNKKEGGSKGCYLYCTHTKDSTEEVREYSKYSC